jgi:hypothetical protein
LWPIWALGAVAATTGIAFVLVGIDPLWALPIVLCLGITLIGGVELWEVRKARPAAKAQPNERVRKIAR